MALAHPADPGKVFTSDTHRRIVGHLPLPDDDPIEVEALGVRLGADLRNLVIRSVDDLKEVLSELEAEGLAKHLAAGWKMTKEGFEALTAPLPEEPEGEPAPAMLTGLGELG